MVFFLLAILLAFLSIYYLYIYFHMAATKSLFRTALLLPASLFLGYSYFWYDAFYPSNKFYKDEFTNITNLSLPANTKIIRKSSSYPDQHGDYSSCVAITVSHAEFEELFQKVERDTCFSLMRPQSLFIGSSEFDNVTSLFKSSDYLAKFSGEKSKYSARYNAYTLIAFLTGHKTVIVYRVSS